MSGLQSNIGQVLLPPESSRRPRRCRHGGGAAPRTFAFTRPWRAGGYTIFETTDQRQLMHLGHPEYNAGRILAEMERDKARGDVPPPEN